MTTGSHLASAPSLLPPSWDWYTSCASSAEIGRFTGGYERVARTVSHSSDHLMRCLGCLAQTLRLSMLSRSSACLPAGLGPHSPSYGSLLSYCSGSATEQGNFSHI